MAHNFALILRKMFGKVQYVTFQIQIFQRNIQERANPDLTEMSFIKEDQCLKISTSTIYLYMVYEF